MTAPLNLAALLDLTRAGQKTNQQRKNLQNLKGCVNMTEHDIQNSIRMKLSELGYCVFRVNVGRFKTEDGRWFDTGLPKGFSDLMAVKDGRVYFLEVKTETGKASPEQLNFLAVMRDRYGCVTSIVRSVDDAVRTVTED